MINVPCTHPDDGSLQNCGFSHQEWTANCVVADPTLSCSGNADPTCACQTRIVYDIHDSMHSTWDPTTNTGRWPGDGTPIPMGGTGSGDCFNSGWDDATYGSRRTDGGGMEPDDTCKGFFGQSGIGYESHGNFLTDPAMNAFRLETAML